MSMKLLKIACALCVVALVACGAVILGRGIHGASRYDNAEQYTAGGATLDDAVKNLDIHWIDGSVYIAYHAGNAVEIAETAPKAIEGDAALRWWLDGDTLRVRYAKSGFRSFHGLDKALTVTLPEGIALESVAIDSTSGNVTVPGLSADDVKVSMTSGDLAADVDAVESMNVSVTSGDIRVGVGSAGSLSVASTSGRVTLEGGDVQATAVDSTSGDVSVRLTAFSELKIKSTSGGVTAALPAEPGYRADIGTTSGKFDYTVALSRDGDAYTCGDGSARVRINTTSGNIRLTDVNE